MNARTKDIFKPRIELARAVYAYTMDILNRALAHDEKVSEAEVNANVLPRLTELLLRCELTDVDTSVSPLP